MVRGNSLYMVAVSRRCVAPDPKLRIWQEETGNPNNWKLHQATPTFNAVAAADGAASAPVAGKSELDHARTMSPPGGANMRDDANGRPARR